MRSWNRKGMDLAPTALHSSFPKSLRLHRHVRVHEIASMHTSRNRGLPYEESAPKLTHRVDRNEAAKRLASKALRGSQRLVVDDALLLVSACGAFACCSRYRITVSVMFVVLS